MSSTPTIDVLDANVDRFVSQGVQLAVSVAQLPTIPTADWCRNAAKTIAPLGEFQRSAVGIARMSHNGAMIEEVVSVGVHVPGTHGEHLEDALVRLRRCAWLPAGVAPSMDRSWVTALDAEAMRKNTSTASPWALTISPKMAVATAPFGDACSQYLMISVIGSSQATLGMLASSPLLPALRSLTVLLAQRAMLAMGCPDKPIRWISPREQEVLELLIEGLSVKEIGESLGRSPHTITDHLKSLHRKLNANSRGELVAKALGRPSTRKNHEAKPTIISDASEENYG